MSAHLDNRSRRPGLESQRVNVDFPKWMIESLDDEAGRLGVPRQSVIKFWISQCLEEKIAEGLTNRLNQRGTSLHTDTRGSAQTIGRRHDRI